MKLLKLMKLMKWFVVYVSCILFFFGLGTIVFPQWYIFELIVSFLPYMLVFHLFLVGYLLAKVYFVRRWWSVVLVVLHIVFFLYFFNHFTSFYGVEVPVVEQDDGVGVLYANVSKVNYNYSGLISMIEAYDPAIVMFVEFADHHGENLKPFLEKEYPYVNRTSWSRTFVGSMVFSRFPIDDLSDDFVQWAWRYGYFSIDLPDSLYYVYLVHTSSPISLANYRMRNTQLAVIADHITTHQPMREDGVTLFVGDLNVSPWSLFYSRLADSIDLENVTRRFPAVFSWRLYRFPLVWSHIDHIFSSEESTVLSIEQVVVPWSDHRGYYFTLSP